VTIPAVETAHLVWFLFSTAEKTRLDPPG